MSHLIGPVILATSCRPRNSQDYIRRTVSNDPVGSSPLGSLPCGAARDPQTVANIEALGERVVHNSKFFSFFSFFSTCGTGVIVLTPGLQHDTAWGPTTIMDTIQNHIMPGSGRL